MGLGLWCFEVDFGVGGLFWGGFVVLGWVGFGVCSFEFFVFVFVGFILVLMGFWCGVLFFVSGFWLLQWLDSVLVFWFITRLFGLLLLCCLGCGSWLGVVLGRVWWVVCWVFMLVVVVRLLCCFELWLGFRVVGFL